MTDCDFCHRPGFILKYDELRNRYVLYDPGSELPHKCRENPWDVQESVERFTENFHKKWKFKIPIWCHTCETHYRPDCVCGHLKRLGFVEGMDNVTYFADSWEARENRRAKIKKIRELIEQKDESLGGEFSKNESLFRFTD